jgi:2-iminobutanoate/2-iminopropanoate deaminase
MIAVHALSPSTIRPPLARYSHGIAVPANHRLVITAGQLGIALDESIPADSEGQANICLANITAILAEDRMTMADIVRLSVYVTAREHMDGYRRARDRHFPGTPPTTTLIMVAGLVRPEFVIEIEAIAAAVAP